MHKNLNKKILLIMFFLMIISGTITYKIIEVNNTKKNMEEERKQAEKEKLKEIEGHYGDVVKTNKDTNLYVLDDNEYQVSGIIYSDVLLDLDEEESIELNTKYFKIKDKNYYIDYQDVLRSEEDKKKNTRYKKYLVFNENVITKDNFTLYLDDKKMYTFNFSMSFPIIIKNYENRYYVEYDGMLLNILNTDVERVEKANNTSKINQSKITTLAYHRIYDDSEICTDPYVCMKKENFDMEMKYLKDNDYLTLTMDEMYMYLNGSLQVEKAVCLTIDDGLSTKNMIEILEKYDLQGTLFVVTGITNNFSVYNSPNLLVQSHTDNLHRNYVCRGGSQGGAILCASYDEIKKDIQTSIQKLGTKPIAFAFPFYDYNQNAISVLKDLGFKMAFIGRAWTEGRATPNYTDLYKIPRMTVWEQSIMSFNTWKSYL